MTAFLRLKAITPKPRATPEPGRNTGLWAFLYAHPHDGFVTRALASLLSYGYTAPVSYHYGECDEVY